MTNARGEIEAINMILRGLRAVSNPSPQTLARIEIQERKLARLRQPETKPFVPHRNERGRLVINEVGDTEDDI